MMQVEIRGDAAHIEGYVNAVARDSKPIMGQDGERFVEQIEPGAFSRAIDKAKAAGRSIRVMLNHRKDLGGTGENLSLKEDSIGLYAEADITDPTVIDKARAHKLRGWSFGFTCANERTEKTESLPRRHVQDLDLIEVTIVDDRARPAYAGTSIETRSEDEAETIEQRHEDDGTEYTDAAQEKEPTPPDHVSWAEATIKILEG